MPRNADMKLVTLGAVVLLLCMARWTFDRDIRQYNVPWSPPPRYECTWSERLGLPCRAPLEERDSQLVPKLEPHMTEPEKELFLEATREGGIYFEFGCGGSTTVVARNARVKEMMVVDAMQEWIDKVKDHLPPSGLRKVNFKYVDINAKFASHPKDKSKKHNWPLYSQAIRNATSSPPDLVFIDGRFRVACAFEAWHVIRPDTLVLMHDYDRRLYHVVERFYRLLARQHTLAVLRKRTDRPGPDRDIMGRYRFDEL